MNSAPALIPPATTLRIRWRQWLEHPGYPEFLLILLSFAVYARSLAMGFVFDDHSMIENLGLLRWADVPRLFVENAADNHASNFYRPLTALWIDLVYRASGANPTGWHLAGLLLHIACVVLVFRLACHLLEDRPTAAFAAAIFALHPTHVEAVTWISDSADALMADLLLLSALAILRWVKNGNPAWWMASWMLATACCFVKETAVVMPVLLIVVALSVKGKVSRPALMMTGGCLFISSFFFLILRSRVLHGFSHPLSNAGSSQMILTLPAAVCFYLRHLVFPVRLGYFYPLEFVTDWRSAAFLLPVLGLLAVLVVVSWLYVRLSDHRLFWFCAAWTLAPLAAPLYIKLFPRWELVHDRYLYLPTIALAVALGAAVKKLGWASEKIPSRWISAGMALILVAGAAETITYQSVWKNDRNLFERALLMTPRDDRAMVNLGVVDLEEGKTEQGIALLQRALEIEPNNALALFDLGKSAWNRNDPIKAENYFEKAVELEEHPRWWLMLANAKLRLGKLPEAKEAALQAIELNPAEPGTHLLLAGVLVQEGNLTAAESELRTELQYHPGEPEAMRALQFVQDRLEHPPH
jgi:protein O-mannosyl-transferase